MVYSSTSADWRKFFIFSMKLETPSSGNSERLNFFGHWVLLLDLFQGAMKWWDIFEGQCSRIREKRVVEDRDERTKMNVLRRLKVRTSNTVKKEEEEEARNAEWVFEIGGFRNWGFSILGIWYYNHFTHTLSEKTKSLWEIQIFNRWNLKLLKKEVKQFFSFFFWNKQFFSLLLINSH